MRNEIIEMIENALLIRQDFFTREQEIQIYLANFFAESNEFDNIYLEYHLPSHLLPHYPWIDSNNIYIDIVLEKNNIFYPIEIKYKTTTQNLPINIFGSDTIVVLGHHGAQNIGCYDFWKDIKRLEIFENQFQNVEQGIMLFVTNDESYFQPPLKQTTGYAQFSIHNQRVVNEGETLSWNKLLKITSNRPPITLYNSYTLNWNDLNLDQHKYLLI